MNAVFIIKYDSIGNEIWWKKAAGAFAIPYSMVMDNGNNIYITGDFQGTLSYFGTSLINFVNGAYSNKAFLLKIDNGGNFIWGKADASNNYLSSKNVALDAQQDPYIFGEFGCTHSEYSSAYGSGVFNSVGFQDFFITKYNNTGIRQWFRQYGGPRNDKAHGLLISGINEPIMAGSYEHHLNIPGTLGSIINLNNAATTTSNASSQTANYCSAPNNYSNYLSLDCNGYTDMFIHKGIDLTRNPYDYYERNGTGCNLTFQGNCIEGGVFQTNCPDTIRICTNDSIFSNTKTTYKHVYEYKNTNNDYGYGPIHDFIWNNNINDSLQYLFVNSSGINTVKATTIDGCYTSYDTVYVKLNPLATPPTISDSYGANVLQLPVTNSIAVCGPATYTLTGGSNGQNVMNYNWETTSGNVITQHDSVAVINSSGTYSCVMTDVNGCRDSNEIVIRIDPPYIPFAPKQKLDTISYCTNLHGLNIICDSLSNPLLNYPYSTCFNYNSITLISSTPGFNIVGSNSCDLSFFVTATATGNYTYNINYVINNLCTQDTINYTGHVYIIVKQSPIASLNLSSYPFCPGDSSLITTAITGLTSNTNYTITPTPAIWVSDSGLVEVDLFLIDTINGCAELVKSTINVIQKPNPFIILNPYNSIICPNDSMKLSLNLVGAINYEWHGPTGLIPGNSQSIYSQTPGFYYNVVTDNTGCVFITNTVELKQYATPYIVSEPTGILCNNQPINLHVITLDSSLIVWNAPLSGGGATKVITSPGVYSCNATMCGITTSLSINIIGSNPIANITSIGSLTVCPFDSVQLSGDTGMSSYIWQPGNYLGQQLIVHQAGTYSLQVVDAFGCLSTLSVATVSFSSSISPPINSLNDTVCSGQAAPLSVTATGGNTVDWFASGNSGSVLNTGTVYTTPTVTNQTTYYAASVSASGCHSFGIPVTAYIYPASVAPLLIADTTVCKYDTLKISTPFISGATYSWTGNGVATNTTNIISIANADSTNNGIYTLQVSGVGCTSAISSVNIQVLNPIVPSVTGNDSICENGFYTNSVNPVLSNYTYNWQGPNSYTSINNSIIITSAQVNQTGTYTVTSNLLGCASTPSTIHLTVLQVPSMPIIISNSVVCVGDTVFLSTTNNSSYTYSWLGQNGFTDNQPQTYVLANDTSYSGVYSLMAINVFCISNPALDTIQVMPYPILIVSNDTIACDNSTLNLVANSNYANYAWNTGATNNTINVTQSGVYWVTSQNGPCAKTDTVHVSLISCGQMVINVFTPNGDGVNDVFRFSSSAIKEVHCTISNRWGEKVGEFNDVSEGWNGQHIGNKINCDVGTYFYVAEITTIDGVKQVLSNFVTLIR
jgi:gliding motility-associated-like protein